MLKNTKAPRGGVLNNVSRAKEMGHWVEAFSAKPEDLSLIPGIYVIVEREPAPRGLL